MQQNPPRKILILGGGTAGWMAASLLAEAWQDRDVEITLLESATIGIVGVGEGSTPKMRRFFNRLGVADSEWMPACNATYKCGIRFPAWSTRKGFRSYYHPFFSLDDDYTIRAFFHNTQIRAKNVDVHAHPDAFFVSNYLSKKRRAPIVGDDFNYHTEYAYHFDAALIGKFLKAHSMARGVRHMVDTVASVNQRENGDIDSVETEAHGKVEADFFVDCTGFASVLICRTLNVPFISYQDILFNDCAVALPTPLDSDDSLPSQTISTALKYGWVWKIPLTNRFGNGYVYSSSYVDAEGAEQELRQHINLHDPAVEARHLKMRIGRLDHAWHKNCLAVGLSQGFIEPLEATALMIVQDTVENFIDRFEQGAFTDQYRDQFNDKINRIFDGVKDYIFLHYKLNSRTDTDYWADNRGNENASDLVDSVLDVWDRGGDLLGLLKDNADRVVYSPTSWFCILAGMGRYPRKPKKPKKNINASDPELARQHCEEILAHFPDHRGVIDAMTPMA